MKDLIITSLETITAFDPASGAYLFTLDELQNASIANTEEKVDITGKQGRKLSSLKRNKGVTISGANGLLSGGLMELQSGGTFENKATNVMWADYLSVSGNKATTSFKAVGTAGAEIKGLYVRNADGTLGDELTQADTAAAGKFAYAPATKTLTFNSLADGTEIVAYYERKITADVLVNESDKYSKKAMLYIDAIGEDRCANVYRIQFFVPKADFNGEYSIDLGDDQVVQNFEAEALAGACGVAGVLWTYTVFGENAEDAE